MTTSLTVSENILRRDEGGVWRVGNSRVSLDSVIYAFNEGASAEEIVWRFSTLDLVQVYSVISYYLQNRDEVEDYLRNREQQRAELRREIENRFSPQGIRERLLARRTQKK
ncbi:MAG: DUF433 domain-containing protein [Blastocatellia bacterium]|nr:DUF433 domain-containing protein [Blastocatellia bacterium]